MTVHGAEGPAGGAGGRDDDTTWSFEGRKGRGEH